MLYDYNHYNLPNKEGDKCPECNKWHSYYVYSPSDEFCEGEPDYITGKKHPELFGAKVKLKSGKFGKFLGCENFPKCKFSCRILEDRIKIKEENFRAWADREAHATDETGEYIEEDIRPY